MIKPAIILCDFCGKKLEKSRPISLPVITDCDWTEGRWEAPHVEFENYDICKECLMKSTNIFADFQGSNPRFLDKGEQDG